MIGHIKLGAQGALRPYLLIDPHQYHAEPANAMAPRLNTGEKFAELTGWAEWVQADWQGGVGRTDPAALGVLYSEAETRVPGQLILPQALGCVHTWPNDTTAGGGLHMPREATAYSVLELAPVGVQQWIGVRVRTGDTLTFTCGSFWLLMRSLVGATITARIYGDYTGIPAGVVAEKTVTLAAGPQYTWVRFPFDTALSNGTIYWLCVTASATTQILAGNDWQHGAAARWNGSAWEAISGYPFFLTDIWSVALGSTRGLFSLTRTAGGLYGLFEMGTVSPTHKVQFAAYDSLRSFFSPSADASVLSADMTVLNGASAAVNDTLTIPGTWKLDIQGSGYVTITDYLLTTAVSNDAAFVAAPAVLWDGKVYVALGDSHVALDANTGGGLVVNTGASAFAANAGYIWRSYQNKAYYSGDGSAWSEAVRIGSTDYLVRGMVGLGRDMYCANDEGLFQVTDGDLVMGITPWGTKASGQVRMVNHQNALYIPISGRVLRFSADGTIMDVWVQRQDDLPQSLLGAPQILGAMNHWLLAALSGAPGASSVLAWQTEGWHQLCTLPAGLTPSCLYHDRDLARLWVATSQGLVFYTGIDDTAINPWNSSSSRYMPTAWVETMRFYGDLMRVDKDFESVFVAGDFPAGTGVDIYYQSDQDPTWRLLGQVSDDGEEVRWSDYTLRPTGKWLRLGLLLSTNDPTKSPKVRAIVVKYMPMVLDRERWNLPLMLASNQEMLDGELSTYTAAQQVAHIKSLIRSVEPVVFEDLDGTQYDVKVVGASRQVYELDMLPGAQKNVTWVYTVAMEQVHAAT
ncbi:MAG: hypothetical protein U0X20_23725 [Caldilineaceae bacterium]